MNSAATRIWTFATVLIMIVVVALGWFLGVSPKLADAARFDSERLGVQAQNDLARAAIAQLQQDFEQIDELLLELAFLREEFPTEAEYDSAVEELVRGLLSEGLTLQNLAINEPAPTSAAPVDEGAEPPAGEVDGAGALPTGSLLQVSTTVTVNGDLPSILAFIEALQQSPRFAVIATGDFSNGSSEDGGDMTFSMIIYVVTGDDQLTLPPIPDSEPEPLPEPTDTATPAPGDPSATPTPTPEPTP
ncbi:hypothetical protein [Microcella sp.]|uniref:hypothetical protein n=1 Tax=Microcella sp. TaxID=1913979 RepID=UPI00391C99DB